MGGREDLAGTIRSDPSPPASTFSNGQSVLTDEQQTKFRTQGYLLVPDALDSIGLERIHSAYEKIRRDTEPAWRRAIALSYMSARAHFSGEGEGPVYFPIRGSSYPGCVR